MHTLMRGGIGTFIVAGFCLLSLQPKLFPCRTLPSGIQNVVDKSFFYERSMVLRCSPKILPMLCPIHIGPLFHQGFHTKDGFDFLLAHGHRPVRPTRLGPSGLVFYFYPLQLPPYPIWSVAFCARGANWGDGQSNTDGSMFMGVTNRNICER